MSKLRRTPETFALETRMVIVNGKRRPVQVCKATWAALEDIADREATSVEALLSAVAERRPRRKLGECAEVFAAGYFIEMFRLNADPAPSCPVHESVPPLP